MRRLLLATLLMLPLPATAETPMDAAAFEAYVTGKTLTYSRFGEVFGTEQYLAGKRVRWAFTDDICTDGSWYQEAEYICFLYPAEADPQCWVFIEGETGLVARYRGDPPGAELAEVAQSPEPLACPGPDVGV